MRTILRVGAFIVFLVAGIVLLIKHGDIWQALCLDSFGLAAWVLSTVVPAAVAVP